MEKIRLIGRNSRLSLLQIERVKQRIVLAYPDWEVEVIARSSQGDELSNIPLQTMEGSDFFTQDIFDALEKGEADIAVHSLKDMSYEHFSGTNEFAVTEREDVRDVALFRKETEEKIKKGETIVIGTCSPRREEMAIGFLQKALPQSGGSIHVATKFIRGNVDTRLRKLDEGEFDGILLATAGLNRLLSSEENSSSIRLLLKNKRFMVLPLMECVPAPCQGAIVAEAHPGNEKAVKVLQRINNEPLFKECVEEKKMAAQFGIGCLQKFGVTTIHYGNQQSLYAAGKDAGGKLFTHWASLPEMEVEGKVIFSSTDFMGNFFAYEYAQVIPEIKEPVVYVANYKVIGAKNIIGPLKTKRIWAAGTKTWLELAKKGIWVEGSADALGLDFLEPLWGMQLLGIDKKDICILTHREGEANWKEQGWTTASTYSLRQKPIKEIKEALEKADIVFWTGFRQYELYKEVLKKAIVHACPSGETSILLKKAGLDPVVFPTIKAFQQWRKTISRSRNAA
jgi:hydroxymethylbilane synthase